MDTSNITLIVFVCVFWLLASARAQQRHYRWFPNFVFIPLVFIPLGLLINRIHSPNGTYVIIGLHILLLMVITFKNRNRKA